jgi:hypothetical protein
MSNLLWTAAEAYLKNKYLHINQSRIESIQQSLKLAELHIRQVQELAEEDSQPMMYNFDMILERVINLEEEIKNTLDKPKIIEEAIQSLLIQEPWQKTKLLNLIQSY